MYHILLQSLLFTTLSWDAAASPHSSRTQYHSKRQDGVVRSPCPGLNVLANEGFINSNGLAIKLTDLQSALETVYNFDTALASALVYSGRLLTANSSAQALEQTIDLDNLDKHGGLEHDASLTREDYSEGDQVTFQPTLFAAVLADSPTDYLTVESLAASRVRRENYAASLGDSGTDIKTVTLAYIEAGVILLALGNSTDTNGNPQTAKSAATTWFTEERLPDGWVTPPTQITIASQLAMSEKIQSAADIIRG